MDLRIARQVNIPELTRISKAAFDTDVLVGYGESDGPPGYDSLEWHEGMRKSGNLYVAVVEDAIVGGAILFPDVPQKTVYVGRIFVNPVHFCKGYGIAIMERMEQMFPGYLLKLDTPVWNIRTNRFYQKLGYQETGRDKESVYYQKELQS